MAEKRQLLDADPDYEDYDDGTETVPEQRKRQRLMENDGKETTIKKIQNIVMLEFDKEIQSKEVEIDEVDKNLYESRNMLDRLRACIVASFYSKAGMSSSKQQNKTSTIASAIHPATKKFLGKTVPPGMMAQSHVIKQEEPEASTSSVTSQQMEMSPVQMEKKVFAPQPVKRSNSSAARGSWFKVKKRIIVGNVSRYIPMEKRDENDQATHKWMVYVRGPKEEPHIGSFVEKVWFFLHPSYRPNDLVEISEGPFHLTRRGWGEFPIRVQLHFKDKRNKRVDIIHHLKLDRTYTGLQTLGSETVVDVELEKEKVETISKPPEPPDGKSSNSQQRTQVRLQDHNKLQQNTEGMTICHNISPQKLLKSDRNMHETTTQQKENLDHHAGSDRKGGLKQKPDFLNLKLNLQDTISKESGSLFELSTPVLSTGMKSVTPDRAESVSSGFQDLSCHSTPESTSFSSTRGGRLSLDSLPSTPESFNSSNMSMIGVPSTASMSDGNLLTKHDLSVINNMETPFRVFQTPSSVQSVKPSSSKQTESGILKHNQSDSAFNQSLESTSKVWPKKKRKGSTSSDSLVKEQVTSEPVKEINVLQSPPSGSKVSTKYIKIPDNKGRTILVPEHLFLQLQVGGQKEICINISPAAQTKPEQQKSQKVTSMDPIQLQIPAGLLSPSKDTSPRGSVSSAAATSKSQTLDLVTSPPPSVRLQLSPASKTAEINQTKSKSIHGKVKVSEQEKSTGLFLTPRSSVLPLASQGLIVSPSLTSKTQVLMPPTKLSSTSGNVQPQVRPGLSLLSPRLLIPQPQRMLTPSQSPSLLNTSTPNTPLLTTPRQGTSLLKNFGKSAPHLVIRTPNGELKLVNSISADGMLSLQPVNNPLQVQSGNKPRGLQSVPNMVLSGGVSIAGNVKSSAALTSKSTTSLNQNLTISPSSSLLQSNTNVVTKITSPNAGKTHGGKYAPTVRELLEAQRTHPQVATSQIILPQTINQKVPAISLLRPLSPKGNIPTVIQQKAKTVPVIQQFTVQQPLIQKMSSGSAVPPSTVKQPVILGLESQTQQVFTQAGNSMSQKVKISMASQVEKTEHVVNTKTRTTTPSVSPVLSLLGNSKMSVKTSSTGQSLFQPNKVKSILKRQDNQLTDEMVVSSAIHTSQSIGGVSLLKQSSGNSLLPVVKNVLASKDTTTKGTVKLSERLCSVVQSNLSLQQLQGNVKGEMNGEKHLLGISKHQTYAKKIEALNNKQASWRELVQRQLESKAPKKVELPKYRLEDFENFEDLVKTLVKHFPIVAENPDRSAYPYCAASLEHYMSWNVGKRRAAELCRVVALRNSVIELLDGEDWFQSERVWSRRRLVLWCRRHGYTPLDKEISSSLNKETQPFMTETYNSYTDHSTVLARLQDGASEFTAQLSCSQQEEDCIELDVMGEDDEVDHILHGSQFKSPVKQGKVLEDIILADGVGSSFVRETCSKLGIRIKPAEMGEEGGTTLRGHLVEEVLFQASMRFADDILREAMSVIYSDNRLPEEISAHDIHQALTRLPRADFLTNKTLGVEDQHTTSTSHTENNGFTNS